VSFEFQEERIALSFKLREREGGYGVLGYRFSFMVPLPFPTFLAPAWERNKKARGH